MSSSPPTRAYAVTVPWTRDADWETRDGSTPWNDGGAEGNYTTISEPSRLTSLVRGWAGGEPNYGFLLKADIGRDHGLLNEAWAYLDVQYAPTDLANGSTQLAAIEAYLRDTNITASEAARRLTIQDRFNNLADDVRNAIAPDDSAGAWVDDQDEGRIKVGIKSTMSVPPQSKIQAAQNILEDHDLTAVVDFVSVASSLNELEAAANALEEDIPALVRDGKVLAGVTESANAVSIERLSSLTSQETAALDAALDEVTVEVIEEAVDADGLYGSNAQSTKTCGTAFGGWLVCDPPFRGGTRIENASETTRCTGGFFANSTSDDRLYLITAGHCFTEDRPPWDLDNANWFAYRQSGSPMIIGRPHRGSSELASIFLDAGIINVNSPDTSDPSPLWTPPGSNRYVFVTRSTNPAADTTRDERYEIDRVRRPTEGSVYCMTGGKEFTTGRYTVCGRVKKVDAKLRIAADPLEPRDKLIRIDACGPSPGSSGGPLFKNHTGYGIFVLYVPGTCRKYFTRLDSIESRYNVDVDP